MIYLITNNKEYNWNELKKFNIVLCASKKAYNDLINVEDYNLDTETNVVPYLRTRKLYLVQIGKTNNQDQYLFDINYLTHEDLKNLNKILSSNAQKYGHNLLFEYTIIKKELNLDLTNLNCSFLAAKVLTTGLIAPKGFFGLKNLMYQYLRIELNKEEQTTFNGKELTLEQILYAADDVKNNKQLYDKIYEELKVEGLQNVIKLENLFIEPLGDMMQQENAFIFNKEKWKENMNNINTQYKQVLELLHLRIKENPELLEYCYTNDLIQRNDKYDFNWRANNTKEIIKLLVPNLPGYTLNDIKKYLKTNTDNDNKLLLMYLNDRDRLEQELIVNNKLLLQSLGIYTPAGTIKINWNSDLQVLKFFRFFNPRLESTNKTAMKKLVKEYEIAQLYADLTTLGKLYTSYGQNYLDALEEDFEGQHLSFNEFPILDVNQVLNTGRIAMKLLNLIPSKDTKFYKGNDYRNCFEARPGYKIISADFSSQELVVMFTYAGEELMLEAISNGLDAHSYSAKLMFPSLWEKLGGESYPKGKPKIPELNKLRSNSKAINFA